LTADIEKSWKEQLGLKNRTTGRWFKEFSKKLLGDEASKIALARNYAFACRENPDLKANSERYEFAKSIADNVIEELKVPPMRAKREFLTGDETVTT
jgi:hypothetical protein